MKKLTLLLLSVLFAFTVFANNNRDCQAPTNVTVTVQENCPGYTYKYKATISWDAVEGADGYNVYCLDGTYHLGLTNACFYTAGSDNEGTLDFQVATICASGETSDLSESVTAFIGEINDCPAPTGFYATTEENVGGYAHQITYTWDAVEGAESYSLLIAGEEINDITETSYVYGTNESGLIEAYLSTECTAGPSNQSYIATELTEQIVEGEGCEAPENLNVLVEENVPGYDYYFRLTFSWDEVPGATYYRLFTDGNQYKEVLETTVVDGLTEDFKGEDVTFEVQSLCFSDFTEFLTFPIGAGTFTAPESTNPTTGCTAPENFNILVEENVPGSSQYYTMTFSWDPVPGADYYKLFVNGSLYKETSETVVVDGMSEAVSGIEATFAVMTVCASELSEPYVFIIDGKTSIEEYETKFEVYPNPANDVLFIETTEDVNEVNIYNIVGIPVYSEYNFSNNSVNVADLAGGIYFVSIRTDKGEIVKRFIKK